MCSLCVCVCACGFHHESTAFHGVCSHALYLPLCFRRIAPKLDHSPTRLPLCPCFLAPPALRILPPFCVHLHTDTPTPYPVLYLHLQSDKVKSAASAALASFAKEKALMIIDKKSGSWKGAEKLVPLLAGKDVPPAPAGEERELTEDVGKATMQPASAPASTSCNTMLQQPYTSTSNARCLVPPEHACPPA